MISPASGAEDLGEVRELFEEYVAEIGIDLGFQKFAEEFAALPGIYAPPLGRLFLARVKGEAAGCAALKSLGDDVCELKRMFVRPRFRGMRIAQRLAEEVLSEAQAIGYRLMRLDTLPTMLSAIRLYESLGFKRCGAYYETPLKEAVFMELELK